MMLVTFILFILWYLTIGYAYTTILLNNGIESGRVSREELNKIINRAPPNLRMICWYTARVVALLTWPNIFIKRLIYRFRGTL